MEINLLEIIKYNKKCLQDKVLLRNIIADKYPQKVREMNVLLNVYDIGVIQDIARNGSITELQYSSYIQKLVNTYGLQEQLAIQGLNAWIDVFLGNGYSDKFATSSKTVSTNEMKKVIGNKADYELTKLSETTAEIKAYAGESVEDIVVPTEIGGMKIVGIGESAYREHNEIRHIIIPEGIEYIRDVAFGDCENLLELIISSTVKEIGENAFCACYELRAVHLKEGLMKIGMEAFSHCENLSEIIIPSTVKEISAYAFSGCYGLRMIRLKEGLIEIGSEAFSHCESLSEVTIPSSVKEIQLRAFYDCNKLRIVHLNEGLIELGFETFGNCENLSELTIPNTVTRIGKQAFSGCKNLRSVYLNEGLAEIGAYAFERCESLSEVVIPSTVTRIGAHAFSGLNITIRCYASLDWHSLEKNVRVEIMKG